MAEEDAASDSPFSPFVAVSLPPMEVDPIVRTFVAAVADLCAQQRAAKHLMAFLDPVGYNDLPQGERERCSRC